MTGSPFSLLVAVILLLSFFSQVSAVEPRLAGRYFLMGSGVMQLENLRNQRKAKVELLDANGGINEAALDAVDQVFGFPTEEKHEHISPRLLFMLSYFADRFAPGKTIMIESAYRSPEYNDSIRKQGANAARTSTHIDGMALDFWIEGVDGKKMWETIRAMECCGVGHYGGKSIHLDTGRPRFWEAASSGTSNPEPDYNRHIYLSPLFDRYLAGEEVRLSLSGISVFDFGILPTALLTAAQSAESVPLRLPLAGAGQGECQKIMTREATRFLSVTLPAELPDGRYRLQLDFCSKPFPQMPDQVISQAIEVVR